MEDFLLTSDDLSELEGVVTSSSPDEMVITRPTTTKTSQGTFTKTYTTVATVMGRLQPVDHKTTEQERIIAAKFQGKAMYRLQLPYNTDIRIEDRVLTRGKTIDIVTSTDNGAFTIRQHPVGIELT